MGVNPYPLVFAILSISLGVFLWKKGNNKEPFWAALIEVIGNILIFDLPVFATFRAWAVFLSLIGYVIIILDAFGVIAHFFLIK